MFEILNILKLALFRHLIDEFHRLLIILRFNLYHHHFFLVTTSHFSGVVTNICVSYISYFDNCISPVNSRTIIPKYFNLFVNFSTISAASAFIGDIYMHLNSILSCYNFNFVLSILFDTSCKIVNNAIFVLPAPVGAHIIIFSSLYIADLYTLD